MCVIRWLNIHRYTIHLCAYCWLCLHYTIMVGSNFINLHNICRLYVNTIIIIIILFPCMMCTATHTHTHMHKVIVVVYINSRSNQTGHRRHLNIIVSFIHLQYVHTLLLHDTYLPYFNDIYNSIHIIITWCMLWCNLYTYKNIYVGRPWGILKQNKGWFYGVSPHSIGSSESM